jgi:hypothetical protein
MRENTLLVVILCCLQCIASAGLRPEDHRKRLREPAEIDGYPCAQGYAWFYADGHLNQCTVSRDTGFGEAEAPAGSIVVLLPNGKPKYLMLVHNAPVLGYQCMGGGPLGPAEGAMTLFYPSGKLRLCWLAEDQVVQGVPCMAAGGFFGTLFHYGGASTSFHENGKLHSCTLSKDYRGKRRGELFRQAP